jgi:hypothetical protein
MGDPNGIISLDTFEVPIGKELDLRFRVGFKS